MVSSRASVLLLRPRLRRYHSVGAVIHHELPIVLARMFHQSSTAADGPRAGFGGSFALVSVCAKAGTVARQAVRQSPARNFHRFISLLRLPRVTQKKLRRNPLRVPVRGYCMLRRPPRPDVSPALSQ